jgi:chromosome segregation ATPase
MAEILLLIDSIQKEHRELTARAERVRERTASLEKERASLSREIATVTEQTRDANAEFLSIRAETDLARVRVLCMQEVVDHTNAQCTDAAAAARAHKHALVRLRRDFLEKSRALEDAVLLDGSNSATATTTCTTTTAAASSSTSGTFPPPADGVVPHNRRRPQAPPPPLPPPQTSHRGGGPYMHHSAVAKRIQEHNAECRHAQAQIVQLQSALLQLRQQRRQQQQQQHQQQQQQQQQHEHQQHEREPAHGDDDDDDDDNDDDDDDGADDKALVLQSLRDELSSAGAKLSAVKLRIQQLSADYRTRS